MIIANGINSEFNYWQALSKHKHSVDQNNESVLMSLYDVSQRIKYVRYTVCCHACGAEQDIYADVQDWDYISRIGLLFESLDEINFTDDIAFEFVCSECGAFNSVDADEDDVIYD